MSALPSRGTFVKPVGPGFYAYCWRIERAELCGEPDELTPHWTCTRFGLTDDGEPVVDGHQTKQCRTGAVEVAPGVYRVRTDARSFGHPGYYRVMTPRGQLELFQ